MTRYFLVAGELSGDLHAAHLVKELKKKEQEASFEGVAGPNMRKEGILPTFNMEMLQVMGFSDTLKALPRLLLLFYHIRKSLLKANPDCVIFVDYPGLNLRLAHALRKKGYKGKIVYYISPTVWAHGQSRIQTLVQNCDLLLTILPFEPKYFASTPLKTVYVGHPLIEAINNYPYKEGWHTLLGMKTKENILALFPGSRKGEILLHLSQQLQTAARLFSIDPSIQVVIAVAQPDFKALIVSVIEKIAPTLPYFLVPSEGRYELMQDAKLALAKSGTVSLELALHETPAAIHYVLTPLNHFFAKHLLKLKLAYYSLPNLLANESVYPELIATPSTKERLFEAAFCLYFDEHEREKCKSGCKKIKTILGTQKASAVAAGSIIELIHALSS